MQISNQRDLVAGLSCLVVGAAFSYTASGYQLGTASRMGPGYFPFILGALLALIGLIITIRAVLARGLPVRIERIDLKTLFLVLGAICFFAAMLPYAGLAVCIVAVVFVSSFAVPAYGIGRALGAGAALAIICTLTFVWALGLQIPVWPDFALGR